MELFTEYINTIFYPALMSTIIIVLPILLNMRNTKNNAFENVFKIFGMIYGTIFLKNLIVCKNKK